MSDLAANRLRSFIERIENLEAEKAAIAADVKEVKSEAKSAGFDVKIINLVLKRRKMEREELAEQEQLLEVYENAIGQLKGTPLADAAAPKSTTSQRGGDPAGGGDDIEPSEEIAGTVGKERDGWPEEGDGNARAEYDAALNAPITESSIIPRPTPSPDTAAFGETIAKTATRTISDAVDRLKTGLGVGQHTAEVA